MNTIPDWLPEVLSGLQETSECTDEIPIDIVNSEDVNYYRYKCRKNRFHGLVADLQLLLTEVTDEGLKKDTEAFIQSCCTDISEKDDNNRIVKGDIDKANTIIFNVLNWFQNKE